MFRFSKNSIERLKTCDPKLQELAHLALLYTEIDFGISCGHRSVKQQQRLYSFGRGNPHRDDIVTYCDGVKKKSKHNYIPSKAIDIFAYVDGRASWDADHYKTIYKAFKKAADELEIKISWGGNWKFKDYPHIQLR